MTSSSKKEAYVWIWLPGESQPVVAGKLVSCVSRGHQHLLFNYGRSYLERIKDHKPAIPIYAPELPLQIGYLPLPRGLSIPSSIRDAAPDAWGRKVITNKSFGLPDKHTGSFNMSELGFLLESGSDRIGALDFQKSPTEYVPRYANNACLESLYASIERVEKGIPLTYERDQALILGSSVGGARPKALVEYQGKKYIAKFPAASDLFNQVKAEFITMRLAALAGLKAAPVRLIKVAGKDVLLVERFDRVPLARSSESTDSQAWSRRLMVSALTLLELTESRAADASYEILAEIIRHRFRDPKNTLKELFSRLVFNILCRNTDDHARNHAAFWDGSELELTPAYDLCPQGSAGDRAFQSMSIQGNNNLSHLSVCLRAAKNFLLSKELAKEIFEHLIDSIEKNWQAVCDEAELSETERHRLWRKQILNPGAFYGLV